MVRTMKTQNHKTTIGHKKRTPLRTSVRTSPVLVALLLFIISIAYTEFDPDSYIAKHGISNDCIEIMPTAFDYQEKPHGITCYNKKLIICKVENGKIRNYVFEFTISYTEEIE